jgi:hypothetical protein
MPDLKLMPLACPHCGCEAGRYDFGAINTDGKRTSGRSQWPCGFNYELTYREYCDSDDHGAPQPVQDEIVYHACQRISM